MRIPLREARAPLAEAAMGSHERTRELLHRALGMGRYPVAVGDDWVVSMDVEDDTLTRHAYSLSGDTVTLGEGERVHETFAPLAEARLDAECRDLLVESDAAEAGSRWLIRVIRAGVSENHRLYPPAVLREATVRFEGARVFAVSDREHLAGSGKDVRNLIGGLRKAAFVESAGGGEIRAELELLEPDGSIGTKLREAWRREMTGLFGFSIQARGRARRGRVEGQTVHIVEAITEVDSVDLIVGAAAGGELIGLIEARGDEDMKLRERMVELIEARLGKARLKTIDTNDDDAVEALYREAIAAPDPGDAGAQGAAPSPDDIDSRIDARVALAEARATARVAIAESGLPEAARKRLVERFAEATAIGATDVADAIGAERAYLAEIAPGGQVRLPDIAITEGREDKVAKMVDALFDPEDATVTSLKECYIDLTGDRRVTGERDRCDAARLRESIQTGTGTNAGVLAQVFGDSIARRAQRLYRNQGVYGWWMDVVDVVPVNDFRTQRRIIWGGYGDLPTVSQGDPYSALASPKDIEETYSVTKRGGTEAITIEAIKNDDMAQIQRIPTKLARAAQRTVSKFVSDFFTANAGAGVALEDATNLFDSSRNNSGTAALSATSVAAGRLAMVKQEEMDSGEQLGIQPKCLLVPWELQETAFNLFTIGARNDPNFVQQFMYKIVPVPHWTDANDWVLVADPMDIQTIEVGFLDGVREPEIFLQSMETVGSLFDKDEWTYKIRHIYGGSVMDYRGFYKGIAA